MPYARLKTHRKAGAETVISEEVEASGAYEQYGDNLTMATAFGSEGCLILSIVAKVAPTLYVFNLDA